MKAKAIFTVFFLICCTCLTASAQADKSRELVHSKTGGQNRTALVIGNGDYQAVGKLNNAVKDARDVSEALRELGFEVIYGENLTTEKMKRSILEFGEKLTAKKGVGVFYFAGHGVQLKGRNYLIPVEAKTLREQTVEFDAVDVNRVLAEMEAAANNLNLVILDACRNNPFTRSWRSTAEGLAGISAPSGTLIAYATAPGEVASDGTGANGLYTSALLKWMREPDMKVEEMFKKVRVEVAQQSQNKQIPWESSSLQGDFYFNPKILKQAIADAAKKKAKSADSGSLKVSVNPALGARPKFKGKLLKYSFETPFVRNETDELAMQKKEVFYFAEKLNQTATLEMIEIRGGSFQMGSTPDEARRAWQRALELYPKTTLLPIEAYSAETPQRTVNIKPFFMSKYEITQGQWKAIMGDLPKFVKDLSLLVKLDDNYPVFGITWAEANDFCKKLSEKTGKKYRLPTEAEWEYAARAGSETPYAFGERIDRSLATFGYASVVEKPDLTVTKYYPNAFGLYQMHGNVDEYCEDVWIPNYQNAPTDGSARKSGNTTKEYVIRGGNFLNLEIDLRSASRDGYAADDKSSIVGFRVVGEIP